MNDQWIFILLLAAAIGSAMIAGLFYAFSTFIMQALGRLPTAAGAAAMQSINATILNPLFFALFFGTAAASLIVLIAALLAPERSRRPLRGHRRRALPGRRHRGDDGVQRAAQ